MRFFSYETISATHLWIPQEGRQAAGCRFRFACRKHSKGALRAASAPFSPVSRQKRRLPSAPDALRRNEKSPAEAGDRECQTLWLLAGADYFVGSAPRRRRAARIAVRSMTSATIRGLAASAGSACADRNRVRAPVVGRADTGYVVTDTVITRRPRRAILAGTAAASTRHFCLGRSATTTASADLSPSGHPYSGRIGCTLRSIRGIALICSSCCTTASNDDVIVTARVIRPGPRHADDGGALTEKCPPISVRGSRSPCTLVSGSFIKRSVVDGTVACCPRMSAGDICLDTNANDGHRGRT